IGHGQDAQLEVREVPLPYATGDLVRVRVHAAGLNRADLLQLRGVYPAPPGVPADIPGLEFAGEVDQIGNQVLSLKVGDRVFGIVGGGAQAEYLTIAENNVAVVPENLNLIEAAAVPEAFITAHDALFTQGDLRPGEKVLIHAAGSGVGLAAIQLARVAGATVYATARTQTKLKRAIDYGVTEGILETNLETHLETKGTLVFANRIHDLTSGKGVDLILDLVGASYFTANIEALAPRGRLILVGTLAGSNAAFDISLVMRKRLRMTGTVLRSRTSEEKAIAITLFRKQVVPLFESGKIVPIIDSIYPFTDARSAYDKLASNKNFGKIILSFPQET
ncbi:MAG: NAD(P)H-quinone oxidoreductase, partial [Pyrinomonadaceae bacterium]